MKLFPVRFANLLVELRLNCLVCPLNCRMNSFIYLMSSLNFLTSLLNYWMSSLTTIYSDFASSLSGLAKRFSGFAPLLRECIIPGSHYPLSHCPLCIGPIIHWPKYEFSSLSIASPFLCQQDLSSTKVSQISPRLRLQYPTSWLTNFVTTDALGGKYEKSTSAKGSTLGKKYVETNARSFLIWARIFCIVSKSV